MLGIFFVPRVVPATMLLTLLLWGEGNLLCPTPFFEGAAVLDVVASWDSKHGQALHAQMESSLSPPTPYTDPQAHAAAEALAAEAAAAVANATSQEEREAAEKLAKEAPPFLLQGS